jgi:two-component system, OmpR family, phosphate regulon sensor histidine kinase PhoR
MDLKKLAALIRQEHEPLLKAWREQVRELASAKHLDTPTLNDHMPRLLAELAAALEAGTWQTIPEAVREDNKGGDPGDSAKVHGLQRLQDDFDINEVVAEYNILRGCIHDLASENDIVLQGKSFHVINRVFDHAIGLALESFSAQRALEIKLRREEYLSFVAHDLQTPLFAISLAGRVLEKSLPRRGYDAEAARMLKTLRRSVQQLDALVRKVLEENANLRTESGLRIERRQFDLWPLVEALHEDLQAIAEATGTRLHNQVPDDLTVFADAGFLRRVFQNLVSNAIKFAPGGTIKVGARNEGGAVECWVTDDGAGLSEETLARVFDNEGGNSKADGSGLGLAIVKQFTEAHGGLVSVQSKPGEGATFRFSLPDKKSA